MLSGSQARTRPVERSRARVGRKAAPLVAFALALACLAACYRNAGPVITEIRSDKSGLHYVRCDLIVGRSLFTLGSDDLEHCVDETGKDVASPTPDQPHALEMPVTTKDAGARN